MAVDLDGVTSVRNLLAGARCVLFDFDGPICRLFPDGSSKPVADQLRATSTGSAPETSSRRTSAATSIPMWCSARCTGRRGRTPG